MEHIAITGTSSWALLARLYLQVLPSYVQLSYCSFDKVGLNTLDGELDNYWQGCPEFGLKLKAGTVPHGGDAELLNAMWGISRGAKDNKGLRE